MAFMVREVASDDHGNSWELERFGPYATRADAVAQAQHLASQYDAPGDRSNHNGQEDWWGRDQGDPLTHHFEIEPTPAGARTLVDRNGIVWWGRLERPPERVIGGGRR